FLALSGGGENLVEHLRHLIVSGDDHAVQLLLIGAAHQAGGAAGSHVAVGGVLCGDAQTSDVLLGNGGHVGNVALVVHGDLVEALRLRGVRGVDVVVCSFCDAGQLALLGVGVVVVRQHLVAVLLDVVGQVHSGVIQQQHLVLYLGVDVVVLGLAVHHKVQHIGLCGIRLRHGIHLFVLGVARFGDGGQPLRLGPQIGRAHV